MYVCVCVFVYASVCVRVVLRWFLSAYQVLIYVHLCLSACLSDFPSVCLSVVVSLFGYVCKSVCVHFSEPFCGRPCPLAPFQGAHRSTAQHARAEALSLDNRVKAAEVHLAGERGGGGDGVNDSSRRRKRRRRVSRQSSTMRAPGCDRAPPLLTAHARCAT